MKLAGVQLVRNAVKYDYCFEESILSMMGVCEAVIVVYVDSEDDTFDRLMSIKSETSTLIIIKLSEEDWNVYNDKYRLSYLTNVAIQHADRLGFSHVLSVQADEVLHESSYDEIRKFVESGKDGCLVRRINLWKTPDFELNVPQERMPCSNIVLRLAKANFRAYDDAESLGGSGDLELNENIVMVHYGFVRKKEVMKSKIINMQQGVFGMIDYDKKLDECDVFNPDLWFDPEKDLKPISVTHPKFALEWIKNRP